MILRPKFTLIVTTIALAAATGATAGTAAAQGRWSVTPVISGLNNPRGIAVDGAIYVSEAGVPGSGGFGHNRSGAVSKYVWSHGSLTRAWSTHFASIWAGEGGGEPESLGASGLSSLGNGCIHHRTTGPRFGCQVRLVMGVNHDQGVDVFHTSVPQIGHLYRLNRATGAATNLSDVGDQDYHWTQRHPGLWEEFQPSPENPAGGDANPYGVLITRTAGHGTRTFVADAGANTISEIRRGGTARVIAYIPNETPPGTRDAVPTCIAQGPDGMLYVGALDLLVNFEQGGGFSNVWRVDPDSTDWRHNATLWATGYTTITGCTFDRGGNFWATEMFADNGPSAPPGDIAMAPFAHPGNITHIGGGSVLLPSGIARGVHGSMYVATGAAAGPGAGGVVRISHR